MLINMRLAGKTVATEFGAIKFNDKGESTDLNATQEKKLGALKGFSVKEEAKKEEPKKEEPKKEEPAKEEAPKKAPAKKAPAKKAPAKAEADADKK
jgi:hypothetical protein